ncbi:phage holin family protein [Dactylosporangium salmoneum]|uniref:Phage holin family protein n=1 Tax=Dactylosporangium salmoneum TaxID=53361 RepID=A0ABN3FC29_9ACTN
MARDDADRSIAELVNRAGEQLTTLVRDEIALAKAELAQKGRRAGIGGGLFGVAAVLGWFGLGLALTLAVVALDLVWPLWLAVLVVTVVVLAAAGVAAALGRRQLRRATPLTPQATVANVSADVSAVQAAVREGRTA